MLPIHRSKMSVFNYDDIPAGYYYRAMTSGSPIQKFWHREKFLSLANQIKGPVSVLDIGCGPGSFLSLLGKINPQARAIGVDVAAKQIQFANQQIASQFPHDRIKFVRTDPDAKQLPFDTASFDVVTCIEVIEHVHPYYALKMLEEARRLLKPTGRLLITSPNYRSFWPLIEYVLEKMSPVKYHEQHINKFTPSSFVKFIETAGFEVSQVGSIFMVAPFIAPLSRLLAENIHRLEDRFNLKLGSLLVIEVKILDLAAPATESVLVESPAAKEFAAEISFQSSR